MKTCNRCGGQFPIDHFHKNKASKDGRLGICRGCVAVRQRAYVEANAESIAAKLKVYHQANRTKLLAQQKAYKEKNRGAFAIRKREKSTGFSVSLFAATLKHQGHCCAICGIAFRNLTKRHQHADHCHATGEPRGVLCLTCNTGLGKFGDNPELLRRAAAYLENPPVKTIL